jgi:hypothetical protein
MSQPPIPASAPGPVTWGKRDDGTIWLSIGDPREGPHVQADWEFSEGYLRLFIKALEAK